MVEITIYSTPSCAFCVLAERMLRHKGRGRISTVEVDADPARREAMIAHTGHSQPPQIMIGNRLVGGWDDLMHLEHTGQLDALLELLDTSHQRTWTDFGAQEKTR